MNVNIANFKSLDTDPGGTLKRFIEYVDEMELLFQLVFRQADGSAYQPNDNEKKALMLLKGGKDMKTLFNHVGKVNGVDSFQVAIQKIKDGLSERTNKVVQRNMLLSNFPQGSKSFERWTQEISDAAKLIDYVNYDWKQAAVDAIVLQTSNSRLRERALIDNVTYENLLKLGIAKEQSMKGAALLEQASGQSSGERKIKVEEEVRRLQLENRKLKKKSDYKQGSDCNRCGRRNCTRDSKCPAKGGQCSNCKKWNHFAKVCRAKSATVGNVPSSGESGDEIESSGFIVVGKLSYTCITAKVGIQGDTCNHVVRCILSTDTGVSKTILNLEDWEKVKEDCLLTETKKRFRPYGTEHLLKIMGKARVKMRAENGAEIETWVFIHKSRTETSLLGKEDALRLGIVKLNLKGEKTEVVLTSNEETIRNVSFVPDSHDTLLSQAAPTGAYVPACEDGGGNDETARRMAQLKLKYKSVFSNKTGKFKGKPIQIQVRRSVIPVIQPARRIPLHYDERTKVE